uniref:Uncharacterized protein n=1 Tax=Rhizophora mucronata TaxID=61149 RepID=A0A2P2N2B2_RHIMU
MMHHFTKRCTAVNKQESMPVVPVDKLLLSPLSQKEKLCKYIKNGNVGMQGYIVHNH